jgi:hypothetical protein
LTGWGCQGCPDLKLSNRPVRTRMPGGVAGVPPTMEAPYADGQLSQWSSCNVFLTGFTKLIHRFVQQRPTFRD